MKIKLFAVTLALAASPAFAAMGTTDIPTFAGQAAAAEAAKNATPQSPEQWLARMTDFTRNMSAFRDPRVFVPWSNAVTEPNFYLAMANGMMDPGGWLNMMNSAAHPDAVRNLVQLLDPNVTIKWINASADPAFYTAVLTQLSDPGKLMRWGMMPLDPKLWDLTLSMFNPNTYIRWPMAALDPRAWNLMGNMANPALYTGMAGALVNAQPGPNTASSWLSWRPAPVVQGAGSFSMWDPVAMLGNLSNWIPGVSSLPSPSLPNIGLPTFSAPKATGAVAAPTASVANAGGNGAASTPAATAATAPATAAPATAAPATVVASAQSAAPAQTQVAANKVVLAGDTLFKSGKSGIKDLTKDGKARLDELAARIKAVGAIDQIKIVGHADIMGKAAANKRLSESRARSVKSYLIAKGVKPGVILTSGVGDTQPVAQCDMAQPKAQLIECLAPNRRVEVEISARN
ncbi:MAG: OmpA family protein [Hydrogenophilales bacterium]|nr:OmpA family protein [Hydrogenophilales bacterium]